MPTSQGKNAPLSLADILSDALDQTRLEESESTAAFKWNPIAPLGEAERSIDLAASRPLYDTWKASKNRLSQSSPGSLKEFNKRLIRRLSIETGILERLYDIDRGTTEALIASGFIEDVVSRNSTDMEPSRLIDILRDQEAAVQIVLDCIGNRRNLNISTIHELHVCLTRHQDFTYAVDQFSNRVDIPLLKGKFKELPNNPRRPNGKIHEYCPPMHVDLEMEKLIHWFHGYKEEDPVVVAAWLHHRFTQIHPYQDGNGRVARAITTLALLQADLLPLVIDRDLRVEYITALENADEGDLSRLVQLFARLERAGIMQALSVDADADIAQHQSLTSAVIESLAQKFNVRKQRKFAELRVVNALAMALRARARDIIQVSINQLREPLSNLGETQINISDGGPEYNNSHWYRSEVIRTANESGKFANTSEDHYFIKASVRVETQRLVFVVSFHHVGRELSGIMEATTFARLEAFDDSDSWEDRTHEFVACSTEPYVFTYKTEESEISASFERWLDAAVAIAFKEFGDRL